MSLFRWGKQDRNPAPWLPLTGHGTRILFQKCGCVAYYMPRTPSTMAICPPEKKGCIEEALEVVEETAFDTSAHSESACRCLPGCTSVDYPYEVTQSKMHRAQFLDLPPDLLSELASS